MAKKRPQIELTIGREELEAGWSEEDQAACDSAAAGLVEQAAGEESIDLPLTGIPARVPAELAPIEHVAEISVPLSSELPSEFPIHLDVSLPPPSATMLRRIAIALDRQQARTSDGQRVVKPTQALRWLLEQATIRRARA